MQMCNLAFLSWKPTYKLCLEAARISNHTAKLIRIPGSKVSMGKYTFLKKFLQLAKQDKC